MVTGLLISGVIDVDTLVRIVVEIITFQRDC